MPSNPAKDACRAGRLVVVCTPIGNLGDMTLRALDVLASADAVYSEDTRVTSKLFAALGIEAPRPLRLDENTLAAKASEVAGRIAAGEVVAYCTDAGMPGVSDPGMRLVAAVRGEGLDVEVLPGASAASTAYVASGFPATSFYFGGFFPRKQGDRAALLAELAGLDAALVFYESPNRLVGALRAVADAFPSRDVAVCRELTKLHEEVLRGRAAEVRDAFAARAGEPGGIRGEVVFVIDGPSPEEGAAEAAQAAEGAQARAAELAAEGLRTKEAARALAEEFGIGRNEAYEMAMAARAR